MKLDQFPGLNTVDDSYEVGFNGLTVATNVDLNRGSNVSRRPGRTKVYTGTILAAWGDGQDFLFIEGSQLKKLNPDYSATVVKALTITTDKLYVLRTATNLLYWSTGYERGVIDKGVNRDWNTSEDNYWSGTTDEDVLANELHDDPMPIGTQMVEHGGRIWEVYDNMIIYTNPYSELTDLRENFIPIGEGITNLGAVSNGIFITTETRTYFISGTDPAQTSLEQRTPFGAIPNTMIQVDGRILGEGQDTLGLLWSGYHGICAGYPNGSLVNITERQLDQFSGIGGAALLRELNGQKHYIAVLQN